MAVRAGRRGCGRLAPGLRAAPEAGSSEIHADGSWGRVWSVGRRRRGDPVEQWDEAVAELRDGVGHLAEGFGQRGAGEAEGVAAGVEVALERGWLRAAQIE